MSLAFEPMEAYGQSYEVSTGAQKLGCVSYIDDDGNLAVIRYSRKTKTQYVMTEVEGKATGWKATLDKGKWVIEQKVTKKKKK